jgi:hypothetical protein
MQFQSGGAYSSLLLSPFFVPVRLNSICLPYLLFSSKKSAVNRSLFGQQWHECAAVWWHGCRTAIWNDHARRDVCYVWAIVNGYGRGNDGTTGNELCDCTHATAAAGNEHVNAFFFWPVDAAARRNGHVVNDFPRHGPGRIYAWVFHDASAAANGNARSINGNARSIHERHDEHADELRWHERSNAGGANGTSSPAVAHECRKYGHQGVTDKVQVLLVVWGMDGKIEEEHAFIALDPLHFQLCSAKCDELAQMNAGQRSPAAGSTTVSDAFKTALLQRLRMQIGVVLLI